MWLNHANKSHRTKIIITKNTILGAKKSFFFTKQFEPRIIKQSKKYIFSINMQIQNVIETYK